MKDWLKSLKQLKIIVNTNNINNKRQYKTFICSYITLYLYKKGFKNQGSVIKWKKSNCLF